MFCTKKEKRKRVVHAPVKKLNQVPDEYLKMALAITGVFEGSGYNNVAGNFDGQGISVGMLQWNYGQGSLQNKILNPLIQHYGSEAIDKFFPIPISHTAYMGPKEAIKFAKKNMLIGKTIKQDWKSCWIEFLTQPAVKKIQLEASKSVSSKAWYYCNKYGYYDIKSYCWFFDIVTQNGGLKGIEPKLPVSDVTYIENLEKDGGVNKAIWQGQMNFSKDELTKILFVWTCLRVKRNRWASDVISRKGTIAHGVGIVHGSQYDFRAQFNAIDKKFQGRV